MMHGQKNIKLEYLLGYGMNNIKLILV